MISYQNTSLAVKTFYGIKFNPGDVHDVPGYINDPLMIRVNSRPKEPPKADIKKSPQPARTEQVKSTSSKIEKEKEQGGESNGSDNNK